MTARPSSTTSLLDRAAGYFIAPAPESARPALAAVGPPSPVRAAVLGPPASAVPLAAALAGALRAAEREAAAVVAVGGARAEPVQRPATIAARRLAARLAARDLEAGPRGRLVWLSLPAPDTAAVPAARRADAAVGVPLVVAPAQPRSPVLDGLLGEQDLIVVATEDPDGPLARLAAAELAEHAAPVIAARPLTGPARMLALAGLAGARMLDDPLRAMVAGGAGRAGR
jgi:hypothetical protein